MIPELHSNLLPMVEFLAMARSDGVPGPLIGFLPMILTISLIVWWVWYRRRPETQRKIAQIKKSKSKSSNPNFYKAASIHQRYRHQQELEDLNEQIEDMSDDIGE